MELSVKNVKVHEDMSEETNCFSADLYDNGKLVAHVKNDGRGGCNMVYPAEGLTFKDVAKYDNLDVEVIIDDLVFEYDIVTKNQSNKFIIKDKEGELYTVKAESKGTSFATMKKSPQGRAFIKNRVLELQREGYTVLNRNV